MKSFLVLFREPDGRTGKHTEEAIRKHQENWKDWWGRWAKDGQLAGGTGLTLNGIMVMSKDGPLIKEVHKTGTEIVGGFLLLKADDLDKAAEIVQSCPIFEFGGYAEIREMQQ